RGSHQEEINQLPAGEFFGEIALVSDQPRTATVKVKSDTARVISFSKSKFIQQTRTNPTLMFSILRAAVARVFKAESQLDKHLQKFSGFRTDLIAKLNQNKVRINNLKVIDYLQSLHSETYKKAEKVYFETQASNGFMYFIVRGEVKSVKRVGDKNLVLHTLEAGDFFGDVSFFTSRARLSTMLVTSDHAEIVPIDREVFMKIVEIYPEVVLLELKSFIWKLINTEKANNALKTELENEKKEADIRSVKKGEVIIAENDPSNETMYFILNGEFSVFKNRGENKKELVNILRKGDFFGELSLISNQPRTATIAVRSDSADLILFSKRKFIEQTKQNPSLMMSILKATIARLLRAETTLDKLIKKIPDIDSNLEISLKESRIENINIFKYVHSVYSSNLKKGDRIFGEGDASNGMMFFLLQGSVSVVKIYNKRIYQITNLEAGDFFGEVSLVATMPRYQTMIVSSERAKIASIDIKILQKIIQINPGFLLSLLRTVIWKLIIMEKAVTKLNIEYDMYEKKI
ncbi:MAG TPA: cyclic nucleotide-binding domain-containing protein, partial [Leptospiraceae bacterium]|nr:cyclic nucleotide-binding domain-containing protein [Leptospiraceae bacterium]